MATNSAGHYRRWDGEASRSRWAWLAIYRAGMKLANKDAQTKFLLWSSVGLIVGNCFMFYAFSMLETYAASPQTHVYLQQGRPFLEMAKWLLGLDLETVTRISELRELLWRMVFVLMIKLQLFWIMISLSRVGPGLIADDIKGRALPIYFAKPVTPITYILGKWLVVATYVGLILLVPNLLSFTFGVLVTGGLHTVGQTLSLAMDLIVAGVGIMVLVGAIMLALSCISSDKRYVSVGWFAVCLLPWMAQSVVKQEIPGVSGWLASLSLPGNVVALVEHLFDLHTVLDNVELPVEAIRTQLLSSVEPVYPAVVLGSLVLLSVVFCHRRVVKFSRSAASV